MLFELNPHWYEGDKFRIQNSSSNGEYWFVKDEPCEIEECKSMSYKICNFERDHSNNKDKFTFEGCGKRFCIKHSVITNKRNKNKSLFIDYFHCTDCVSRWQRQLAYAATLRLI